MRDSLTSIKAPGIKGFVRGPEIFEARLRRQLPGDHGSLVSGSAPAQVSVCRWTREHGPGWKGAVMTYRADALSRHHQATAQPQMVTYGNPAQCCQLP